MTTSAFVGIDLGGTGTRLACRVNGQTVGDASFLTSVLDGLTPAERVCRLAQEVNSLIPLGSMLAAVGIGATGPVDPVSGEIHNPATLPQLSGIDLRRRLEQHLGLPVVIDNDCVAAAVGEWSLTDDPVPRLLMMTLGTGVGGCLLMDGRPLRTAAGTHPEIGHLPIFDEGPTCYCGLRGCWEPQASRTALQDQLSQVLSPSIARADVLPTAARLCTADPAIRDCFLSYGARVGRGLACLQLAYGPSIIVLGGGASLYFPLFEQGIQRQLSQDPAYCQPAPVVRSQLGERAGASGAALLAERYAAG